MPNRGRRTVERRARYLGVPALPLLVETRFRVPRTTSTLLRRARLDALLDGFADRPLTLVAAPTGFGKTTVLADWVRQRTAPTAWLSLEPADDEPVRFTTYLIAAVRRVVPAVGTDALTALQDPRVDIPRRIVGSFVNDLDDAPLGLTIVLDDHHHIRGAGCHAILRELLAALPSHVRLVISSRSDPVLPLGRLRASGRLGEIRADALRFTPEEARAYLAARLPVALEGDDERALVDGTEGWPAALNLAAMSLTAGSDTAAVIGAFGSHRHLVDYLATEVLGAQTPRMREFLLRTSVLGRLSGDLCDAVTGGTDGRTRLAELERANLFVSGYDDQRQWFRYHRLLREALMSELDSEHPRLAPRLRLAASAWHEQQGHLAEALEYALDAGDDDAAGHILARHYLVFIRGGHVGELRSLLARLDRERLGPVRGAVAFVEGLSGGLVGEPAASIDAAVTRLEESGVEDGAIFGIPTAEAGRLYLRAIYPYGDVGRQRAAGVALRAAWPEHPYLGAAGSMALGYTSYLRGDLAAARTSLDPFGMQPDVRLVSMFAVSVRALVELEAGHLGPGVTAAEAALMEVTRPGFHDAVVTSMANVAVGAARLAEGDPDAAVSALQRALHLIRPTQPVQRSLALMTMASARSAAGDDDEARACLAEAARLIDACHDPGGLPARLRAAERHRTEAAGASDGMRGAGAAAPTAAELRVLRLLASPLSQREIAGELYLSPDTVKTHVRRLYRKLGVESREAAVARAREARLLEHGPTS